LIIGGLIKLVLNIVLISNPDINIYGATIGSIVCQGVAFAICWMALNKQVKIKIGLRKHIIKPIFAAGLMGAGVWLIYDLMYGMTGNAVSTIVAIISGVFIYGIAILGTKCLDKEDFYMIPFGSKIYRGLTKVGLYT